MSLTHSVDSLHSGNTSPECRDVRVRSRVWFITSFNDTLTHFEKATYECWCDDLTDDDKYHFHQVVMFSNQIAFNTIKKVYPTAHIQKPKIDVFKCIEYIEANKNGKKSNFNELGERPNNTRFKTVKDLRECTQPDLLDWKQYKTFMMIKEQPKKVKRSEWSKTISVIWIQGPSGVGKSNKAEELADEEFEEIKFDGNFWHGIVDGEGCAVYDDFRDSHMKASEFINFIDYRSHNMNVKGGSIRNEYTKIIITSIQRAEDIYRGAPEEAREQWLRRMQIVDMYGDNIDADAF